ncbi:phosphonate ABC transporter, partial [Pseudomonas syringae pv. tagetis]
LFLRPDVLLGVVAVSALEPRLADLSVALFCLLAVVDYVSLVASLLAVELALAHVARVIGEGVGI